MEKLTIAPPVTVRFNESLLEKLDGLARIRGMDRSDLIRHLVVDAVESERCKWVALNEVFSTNESDATNTKNYKVGHK